MEYELRPNERAEGVGRVVAWALFPAWAKSSSCQPASRVRVGAFERSPAHEEKVTAIIHDLYALAVQENDDPAQVLSQ